MMSNRQHNDNGTVEITTTLKKRFQHRLNAWLTRRIPAADHHKLSNRNIFIMPTRFGFAFIFFVFILFLMATNYQNNIIMLFSYVMASLFITAMMTSFFNMSGLVIKAQGKSAGHVDTPIHFLVTAHSKQRRFALNFNFDQQPSVHLPLCNTGKHSVKVPYTAQMRGRYIPGRLKVSSEYCFGLFITWTRLDFDFTATVYPKIRAIKGPLPALAADLNQDKSNSRSNKGDDEFYELKNYVQGESLSRVAWKQFAKGQGKFSKYFQQNQGGLMWLRIQDMPSSSVEIKLQLLCFLIIEHSKTGLSFGLDLGSIKIPPNAGQQHRDACLTALADHPRRA